MTAEEQHFGPQTQRRLELSPAEGFGSGRPLRLTAPPIEGEDVRRLQQALADAGFQITVNGVFSQETEQAVRAFQEREELAADGIAGLATLTELGLLA